MDKQSNNDASIGSSIDADNIRKPLETHHQESHDEEDEHDIFSVASEDSSQEGTAQTFEKAILTGDVAGVKQCLQNGANANDRVRGSLPVVLAIEQGEEDIAIALVEGGADLTLGQQTDSLLHQHEELQPSLESHIQMIIGFVKEQGVSALLILVLVGLVHTFQALYRCIPFPTKGIAAETTFPGDAILEAIMASTRPYNSLVDTLLEQDIINGQNVDHSYMPFRLLCWASCRGHVALVLDLLKLGVSIHGPIQGPPGGESDPERAAMASPIFTAAISGQIEILSRLLELCDFPIDVRFEQCKNMTVLMASIAYPTWVKSEEWPGQRAEEVVRALMKLGADPNLQDADGKTALAHAFGEWQTSIGNHVATVLLGANADPNIADNNGVTPLHLTRGQVDDTCLLIKYGANPTLQDVKGVTALHVLARSHTNPAALQAVLASLYNYKDPLLDAVDEQDQTALQLLADHAGSDLLRILIDHATARGLPLDINAHANDTATPLERASRRGNLGLQGAQFLLQCGADPNIVTHKEGKTALHEICPDDYLRFFKPSRRHQGIMLTGKPGSGKSTFVNTLAEDWGLKAGLNLLSHTKYELKSVQTQATTRGVCERRFDWLLWSGSSEDEQKECAKVVAYMMERRAPVDPIWKMQALDGNGIIDVTPLGIASAAIPPSVALTRVFLHAGADLYGISPSGRSAFFEVCAAQGWIDVKIQKIYFPYLAADARESVGIPTVRWRKVKKHFSDEHLYQDDPIYRFIKRNHGTRKQIGKYIEKRKNQSKEKNKEWDETVGQACQEDIERQAEAEQAFEQDELYDCTPNDDIEDPVALFLSYGAAVDKSDSLGLTALHHAAANSNYLGAYHLIKNDADLEARDHRGYTPFLYSCTSRHWLTTLDWRDWREANHPNTPAMKSWHGSLASDFLIMELLGWKIKVRRHHHTMSYFLNWKANLLARDNEGNTALHIAARTGNPRIVAFLLRRCGDELFRAVNKVGRTALHYAASSTAEVARLLLEYEMRSDILDDKQYFTYLPMDYAGPNTRSKYGTKQDVLDVRDESGSSLLQCWELEKKTDLLDLIALLDSNSDELSLHNGTSDKDEINLDDDTSAEDEDENEDLDEDSGNTL